VDAARVIYPSTTETVMRLIPLALLPLALGACSAVHYPKDWAKPGAGVGEITYDEVQCQRASDDINSGPGTFIGGVPDLVLYELQESRREQTYQRCMEAKGYSKV
jgi:hypothetical protein